jgi:hypothetical protein
VKSGKPGPYAKTPDSHKVYYGIFLSIDISKACINLALNRIRIGLSSVDAIPVGYYAAGANGRARSALGIKRWNGDDR